jgi:hypothetical protein
LRWSLSKSQLARKCVCAPIFWQLDQFRLPEYVKNDCWLLLLLPQ